MKKKWTFAPLSADFWAGVVMSVTGQPVPTPSEIVPDFKPLTATVTIEFGGDDPIEQAPQESHLYSPS